MPEEIAVEIHGKDVSDFQLSRLVRASHRKYSVPITAFFSDAFIAVIHVQVFLLTTQRNTRDTAKQMAPSFAQEKFTPYGKKGVSGCLKHETAITSSAAFCGVLGG
jgi:hypothetical protein